MRVGNSLSKAKRVDNTTREASRGKFARICAEVDLTQLLIPIVMINGHKQVIEYERLHSVCFDCG